MAWPHPFCIHNRISDVPLHRLSDVITTTVLRPFFRDHPGEPVPEENFWTLWCKGRLTEADTPIIRLGATPSGLTSAHLHHPHFFIGRMPFLLPNQQCQSNEGNIHNSLMQLPGRYVTTYTLKYLTVFLKTCCCIHTTLHIIGTLYVTTALAVPVVAETSTFRSLLYEAYKLQCLLTSDAARVRQ